MKNRKKATTKDENKETNRVEDECRESTNRAIERESERVKKRAREWESQKESKRVIEWDGERERESDRVRQWESERVRMDKARRMTDFWASDYTLPKISLPCKMHWQNYPSIKWGVKIHQCQSIIILNYFKQNKPWNL